MGLSLYINIPFCRSKCAFCDYVQAIPAKDLLSSEEAKLRRDYISALEREIFEKSKLFHGEAVTSVYFGGGTASILTHNELNVLMEVLSASFLFSEDVERTMECSPDTLTLEKLNTYHDWDFNRLSI